MLKRTPIEAVGILYEKPTKDKVGKANRLLKRGKRRINGEIENPLDP